MIFAFLFWVLHPKTKTRKSQKYYKNAIILKSENVALKRVEILLVWHQVQNYSTTLLITWQAFGLLLKAFDSLGQKLTNLGYFACLCRCVSHNFFKTNDHLLWILKHTLRAELHFIMLNLIQKLMHLVTNSNCVKTTPKEVFETIFYTIWSRVNNARLSWTLGWKGARVNVL